MTEPTTERLARDLDEAGAPVEMVEAARAGLYDDFKNPLATPCIQLVVDLRKAGLTDLADRAADGEWDATPEESKAWAESPEGQEVMAALMPTPKPKLEVPPSREVVRNAMARKISPTVQAAVMAAAEAGRKSGCKEWKIRFERKPGIDKPDDELGPNDAIWYVEAIYAHGQISGTFVATGDSPLEACEKFVAAVQENATCFHCKKRIGWGRKHSRELTGQGVKKVCRFRAISENGVSTWVPGCKM